MAPHRSLSQAIAHAAWPALRPELAASTIRTVTSRAKGVGNYRLMLLTVGSVAVLRCGTAAIRNRVWRLPVAPAVGQGVPVKALPRGECRDIDSVLRQRGVNEVAKQLPFARLVRRAVKRVVDCIER